MPSGTLKADITQCSRDVSKVPGPDVLLDSDELSGMTQGKY